MLDCDSGFGGVELEGLRLQCCVDAASGSPRGCP